VVILAVSGEAKAAQPFQWRNYAQKNSELNRPDDDNCSRRRIRSGQDGKYSSAFCCRLDGGGEAGERSRQQSNSSKARKVLQKKISQADGDDEGQNSQKIGSRQGLAPWPASYSVKRGWQRCT
jgi:hypothetical protein